MDSPEVTKQSLAFLRRIPEPQAESSAEARRTVMDMFPGAVVTGVSQIK